MTNRIASQSTEEEASKDVFFGRIATLSEEMITAHGKDFAVGALVLAARFIADNRTAPALPQRTT